jgi:hypothetical protein
VQAAVNQGKRQAREVLELRESKPLPEAGSLNGLLIAEGDSWFDYPFNSVLGELEHLSYEIESVAHKGDTAEEMAYDPGQLAKLAGLFEKLEQRGEVPRAILLSGGGNDVAGNELGVVLNHKQSGLPAVNEDVARGVIVGRLRVALASLIGAVTELSRQTFGHKVPVLNPRLRLSGPGRPRLHRRLLGAPGALARARVPAQGLRGHGRARARDDRPHRPLQRDGREPARAAGARARRLREPAPHALERARGQEVQEELGERAPPYGSRLQERRPPSSTRSSRRCRSPESRARASQWRPAGFARCWGGSCGPRDRAGPRGPWSSTAGCCCSKAPLV